MKRVDKSTKKTFLIACCFQTHIKIIKCGILTFKTLHAHLVNTFNYTCIFQKYFTNATKCDFTNANKCDFKNANKCDFTKANKCDFIGSTNVILIWIFQYH